jgi:multidrug efflux pump subunit AcrA (membrane-fusion protein)
MKRSVYVTAVLLCSLALSACNALGAAQAQPTAQPVSYARPEEVVSEGHLAPSEFRYLTFAMGGTVAEVLAQVGDQVTAGQTLARLGDREQAEAARTSAELGLLAAQQEMAALTRTATLVQAQRWAGLVEAKNAVITAGRAWDAVDTQDFQDQIDEANETVNDRKDDLDDAQEDFDKYKDFSEDNPTRQEYKDKLDQAQNDYNEAVRQRDALLNQRDLAKAGLSQAEAALDEAQYQYDLTKEGADAEQLALAQAQLTNAEAQAAAAQAALDKMDLKAPFAGTVVDVNVVPDELVGTSTWAVLLADFSTWYVETNDLTELEVVKLSVGQSATIVADALPDLEMTGKISEIGQVYKEKSGDITYEVKIRLEEVDPRLRWGMTVEVTFAP